jgi:ABC-type phosphate transport system substrate-binding protein
MKKIVLIIIGMMIMGSVFAQSYKVVVNTSNQVSALSAKEASDLFLKKKTKWGNGSAVMPVDLTANSPVREAFSKQIHGKSTSAVRSFWQQAAFSGSGTAPAEKESDDAVIEFVMKNPGAIGYVSASANTSNVKVVTIN